MTELSKALQSFVDQPAAPPPSIASLMERNRVRRHRRGLGLAGSSLAVVIVAVISIVVSSRGEPWPVAITVTGPSARSAAYLATAPGGYEASGVWQLTIVRGEDRFVYSNETSPVCGEVGTIRVGDRVYAAIDSPESLVRAGEDAHC